MRTALFPLLLVIALLSATAACQRTTFPLAGVEEDKNAPEYSVEPAVNGGVEQVTR